MLESSRYLETSLNCSNLATRISLFACSDNLNQRLNFLDGELRTLGYPSFFDSKTDDIDMVVYANILYDLLQTNNKTNIKLKNYGVVQKTTESEVLRLHHVMLRLKNDIKTRDQTIMENKLLAKQYCQRIETLENKLKASFDKNKKLLSDMTSRDSQYRHDKKKKCQEIEILKEKLQQLIQDKRNERLRGMEILNALQRADGKRGKWVTEKSKKGNEKEMYRIVLANYEEFQSKLLKENEDMRGYLKLMQSELITALNENSTKNPTELIESYKSSSSSTSSASELSEGVFEMPYDIVKEDIEKNLQRKWKALRKVMSSRSSVSEDNFTAQNNDNLNYKQIINEQQNLIEYLTSAKSSECSIPDECLLLEEKSVFEKEKLHFEQQRRSFDKERKSHNEAVLQLETERRNFEIEKGEWLKHNFFLITPFKNRNDNPRKILHSTHKSIDQSCLEESVYAKTPVNENSTLSYQTINHDTTAYSNISAITPPSTAELYRKLGLEYSSKCPLKKSNTILGHKENIEDFHRSTVKNDSSYAISAIDSIENITTSPNQTTSAIGKYLEVSPGNLSEKSKKHLRSRSAPKDVKYFQTLKERKDRKHDRKLYDFDLTEEKRRIAKKPTQIDDLKCALFQD